MYGPAVKVKKASASPEEMPTRGPRAVQLALAKLDLGQLEENARKRMRVKSHRSKAVKVLNALEGMRRNNLTPDQFMISKVPVIPPAFRPFAVQGSTFIPGDANELYRDLVKVRDGYNQEADTFGTAERDTYNTLYGAVRAVYGYGDPVEPKTKERGASGFMKKITGNGSPKYSYFQSKMISKPQDNVGRSTLVVDPDLSLDQVGVPEDLAWTMYKPHIQRRMVLKGMKPMDAVLAIRDKTEEAYRALQEEVKVRPTIYSRAPSWHKFNALAGNPVLVKGKAIAVNPLYLPEKDCDMSVSRPDPMDE